MSRDASGSATLGDNLGSVPTAFQIDANPWQMFPFFSKKSKQLHFELRRFAHPFV
jgi:hypothetical protein